MFDAQSFLDMQIADANSTATIPVPVGEYAAIIDKINVRQWTKKDDPTISGLTLEVFWNVDDQQVKELLGRDKVSVKQGVMLDITEEGGLDMGKGRNVGLGKLRQALGLNEPGVAFSFNQLPGQYAKVSVKHRIDGENIYPEVGTVVKA